MNEIAINELKYVANKKIESFVGLRFIFALAVLLHHLDSISDVVIPGFETVYNYLFEGFVGVNFFFILSGFVIAYGYEKKLKTNKITDAEFVFKRFAKLWPLYIATLIMASFAYKSFNSWFSSGFFVYIFMLQSFIPVSGAAFIFNGVAWCVSAEMFFYMAFCVLVHLSRNKKIIMLMILVGMSILTIRHSSQFNNISWVLYINPFFRIMDFLTGMILCDIFLEKKGNWNKITATIMEIISIIVLAVCMHLRVRYNISFLWAWDLYYIIPVSFLIFVFANDKGYISDILSIKVFQFLGKISFEIYLVHQMIFILLKNYMVNYLTSLTSVWVYTAAVLIISIITALLLHYLVEKPMYKKLCNIWDWFNVKCKGTKKMDC